MNFLQFFERPPATAPPDASSPHSSMSTSRSGSHSSSGSSHSSTHSNTHSLGLTSNPKSAEHRTGWLTKIGGNIKTWRRRYMILNVLDGKLSYFRTPGDTAPLGVIDVQHSQAVYMAPSCETHREHCIAIATATRTYLMYGDTLNETEAWLHDLRVVGGHHHHHQQQSPTGASPSTTGADDGSSEPSAVLQTTAAAPSARRSVVESDQLAELVKDDAVAPDGDQRRDADQPATVNRQPSPRIASTGSSEATLSDLPLGSTALHSPRWPQQSQLTCEVCSQRFKFDDGSTCTHHPGWTLSAVSTWGLCSLCKMPWTPSGGCTQSRHTFTRSQRSASGSLFSSRAQRSNTTIGLPDASNSAAPLRDVYSKEQCCFALLRMLSAGTSPVTISRWAYRVLIMSFDLLEDGVEQPLLRLISMDESNPLSYDSMLALARELQSAEVR
ncbi:hypothetical protein CAOG_08647 [Capsaspora owczarzaki ATCC 30864]|uniref:PH domain-containing protein n=1 Tax=Capsaspora owczarzaki (strain ATCC 30864) TaxID=595528 RepID=A0A0D2WM49_CAPO3|nr:hypothetical protein CAOG_08647 [Capsaspora owczarzaki ATCC 30864]KJE91850.1 hypothetical protein CAOG_008647 [Capsaspora owczarzaki ATCC 30864]|eukprot:XP_011270258.1 hypothetical protein CAOG_08647 [Capsaspora owczarzaki ATCC 30864]